MAFVSVLLPKSRLKLPKEHLNNPAEGLYLKWSLLLVCGLACALLGRNECLQRMNQLCQACPALHGLTPAEHQALRDSGAHHGYFHGTAATAVGCILRSELKGWLSTSSVAWGAFPCWDAQGFRYVTPDA